MGSNVYDTIQNIISQHSNIRHWIDAITRMKYRNLHSICFVSFRFILFLNNAQYLEGCIIERNNSKCYPINFVLCTHLYVDCAYVLFTQNLIQRKKCGFNGLSSVCHQTVVIFFFHWCENPIVPKPNALCVWVSGEYFSFLLLACTSFSTSSLLNCLNGWTLFSVLITKFISHCFQWQQ